MICYADPSEMSFEKQDLTLATPILPVLRPL